MKDNEKDQVPGASQPDQAGVDRRRFIGTASALAVGALAGLSGGGAEVMAAARRSSDPVIEWGPRVDLTNLRDNFAPQQVKDFTVPPGGIDNLGLHSTDVFEIPGQGRFEVDFDGYFRVARAQPKSLEWGTPMIRVNIIDLRLFGQHDKLGEIGVTLNPDILASGQIFPTSMRPETKAATSADPVAADPAAAACRIAVGAVFTVPSLGASLFNKEPILLMNQNLTRIPPVDDPNGHALLFRLPLFNVQDPHGEPMAFLTSLRYGADNYLTRDEVSSIRERRLQA
ncbi:MAG: DUF6073 family protein [Thermoanaerobaculia bacterium]